MLASFFSKSSPINYVLLSLSICIGYITFLFKSDSWTLSFMHVSSSALVLILLIFMLLLVDFIIRKNDVTANNTFVILIFTCFLLMIPDVFGDVKALLSATLLLLSTRRILSLRTGKNIEKKLFDAGIYIALASLLYFWSILFFVVLFIATARLTNQSLRYWFIPLVSFFTVFIMTVSFYLLFDESYVWVSTWYQESDFDFKKYNKLNILVPVTMLLSLLLWMGATRLFKIASLPKKEKPAGVMVLVIGVVSVFISLCSPLKNGVELVFLFFPVSILTTNYIETTHIKERFVFNEILLWVLLSMTLIIGFYMN